MMLTWILRTPNGCTSRKTADGQVDINADFVQEPCSLSRAAPITGNGSIRHSQGPAFPDPVQPRLELSPGYFKHLPQIFLRYCDTTLPPTTYFCACFAIRVHRNPSGCLPSRHAYNTQPSGLPASMFSFYIRPCGARWLLANGRRTPSRMCAHCAGVPYPNVTCVSSATQYIPRADVSRALLPPIFAQGLREDELRRTGPLAEHAVLSMRSLHIHSRASRVSTHVDQELCVGVTSGTQPLLSP